MQRLAHCFFRSDQVEGILLCVIFLCRIYLPLARFPEGAMPHGLEARGSDLEANFSNIRNFETLHLRVQCRARRGARACAS